MIPLLRLVALTPVETLLDVAGVAWVQAPLADGGGLGVFPGHAPLLAETAPGAVRYATSEGEAELALDAGILRISDSVVMVFTSGALDSPTGSSDFDGDALRFERLAQALFRMPDSQAMPASRLVPSGDAGGEET
ncbi:MAG: hypothetical protein JXB35_02855 [Anaerolineae bacterium]|nr:hypothetical protein [Anaerolineae bacterium]